MARSLIRALPIIIPKAIGTFKHDNPNPTSRRLVYASLDKWGKPYLYLSSLGIDGGPYCYQTQGIRKHSKGSMSFDQVGVFQDIAALDVNTLARWVFQRLQTRGVTRDWELDTLEQLQRKGKGPIQRSETAGATKAFGAAMREVRKELAQCCIPCLCSTMYCRAGHHLAS
jgi:hypothetical protein